MKAYERLMNYAKINTVSSETSESAPSTPIQFDLARVLCEELKALGVADAAVSEHCYVTGHIPAAPGHEGAPCLGLIAHMDTAPDFSGENVRPIVHENYDGGDLPLGSSGRTLTVKMFPHLAKLKGRTLITTDGTTLLGADDKAGIAEIMTLIEELRDQSIPHGKLAVCFTPDEEVGRGTENFDIPGFGADFAYTLDGEVEGEIVSECFNACAAAFDVSGVNVHPGSAKDVMVNAALVCCEINSMLPAGDTPRDTEDYQGFFHLTGIVGECEKARVQYIVRDHDAAKFAMRKEMLSHIAELLNAKYGAGTVALTMRDQYRNMAEKIFPEYAHLVENAVKAIKASGVEPVRSPIRGGTDGAQLSWRGLPCPNLGTGGFSFHGPYEHITVEGMDKSVEILRRIVELYA